MSLTESKHKQSTIGADDPFYPREGKTLTWSGVGMNVVSDCKTAVRMINYWLTRTTTPIDILGAKPHCCYYVKRYTTKSCYEVNHDTNIIIFYLTLLFYEYRPQKMGRKSC